MGTSNDGLMCYGVAFPEGFSFPWDEQYDDDGEIARDGMEFGEWWLDEACNNEEKPCPVELVNYCSDGCEMFIVAIPDSVYTANRGYPVKFDPTALLDEDCDFDAIVGLRDFIRVHLTEAINAHHKQYGQYGRSPDPAHKIDTEPSWWLASYTSAE